MFEDDSIFHIISQLQRLGYDGLDTYEPEWVKCVLLGDGGCVGQRQTLMLWMLRHLSPSTAIDIHTAPHHTHTHKILQSLSCMGMCEPGDADIIEGTAQASAQLRFWKACLDSVENLRLMSMCGSDTYTHPDTLMLQLTHSPHLHSTLQTGYTNFVPGDLAKKYRAWVKQGAQTHITDTLTYTMDRLASRQRKFDQLDEQWKVNSDAEISEDKQNDVCDSLRNLAKQQTLLQGVYTSYISPWTTSKDHLELSLVGPLVQDARQKLATVRKALESTEEAAQHCEELKEESSSPHLPTLTPSLTTMLHTLANTQNA